MAVPLLYTHFSKPQRVQEWFNTFLRFNTEKLSCCKLDTT
jgi:hypothetical protein